MINKVKQSAFFLLSIIILSTNAIAKKGQVRISCDQEDAFVYINDKKKAIIGDGFTDIDLAEGEYTIIVKKDIDEYSEYFASKTIFVGEDTSSKINMKLSKIPTNKAKNEYNKNIRKTIKFKGLTYNIISSPYTKRLWLDRNLGAKRLCQSFDDKQCYGDYYQWGRYSDGHEKQHSKTSSSLSLGNTPNHSRFIKSDVNFKYDWIKEKNNHLWQGKNGINNPCPKGFRIPTIDELLSETTKKSVKNNNDIFFNFLRFASAGTRYRFDGSMYYQGSHGNIWTSSFSMEYSNCLYFDSNSTYKDNYDRAYGMSVRCIKD